MKYLDYWLQKARIRQAEHFIPVGSFVLDIGCSDGILFRLLHKRIRGGIGIDPELDKKIEQKTYCLYPGKFPDDLPQQENLFDVITLLAVIEHIPLEEQTKFASCCSENLKPGGRIIITIPSPLVDHILKVLVWSKLVDGMSIQQHFGFEPKLVPPIFYSCDFHLFTRRKFQMGLNNIFVFDKT